MDESPPATLRLVREFVNTAEPQLGTDRLDGPTASDALADLGLLRPDDRLDPGDDRVLIDVREAFRGLLLAHAGHAEPAAAEAALSDRLRQLPMIAAVEDGGIVLVPRRNAPAHRVVAAVLTAWATALPDQRSRLKVCARSSCRWAFYDASRNRSGRWCSMAGCGNIVKMRRARASHAER